MNELARKCDSLEVQENRAWHTDTLETNLKGMGGEGRVCNTIAGDISNCVLYIILIYGRVSCVIIMEHSWLK